MDDIDALASQVGTHFVVLLNGYAHMSAGLLPFDAIATCFLVLADTALVDSVQRVPLLQLALEATE